jgi:PAS domain S-box-containing protein
MKNGLTSTEPQDPVRRNSEENAAYRKIIEAMGHPLAVYKPNGTLVLMNAKAAELLSGQPDDFIGNPISAIFPENGDIYLHRIQSVARNGKAESHEEEIDLPIGRRCFDAAYVPIFADGGGVQWVEIASVDVTERKRSEKELLGKEKELTEAEQVLRDLNETMDLAQKMAGIGYWSYDKAAGRRTWSDQMYVIFGCDPAQGPPVNDRLSEIFHPDDYAVYARSIENALDGTGYSITIRVTHPDGRLHFVNTQGYPRYDRNGAIVGLLGTSQDITERVQAEEALRKSEEKYRSIFENAVEGFFQSTPQGQFISVNPAFSRMLGYRSPEDLTTGIRDISEQYYDNADDRRRYRALLERDGSVEGFEFRAKRKDGTTIWVSNSTRAYFDENGNVLHYEGIVIDITERKRAEAERELLQSHLVQARKMESLGTLSGGIAHEFNNILGIVLGNTELAIEDIPESNLAGRYLQEIRKASLRGKEIVRQLMSFSQNSSQIKKPLNLSAIARESIGLLRAAIPANITFQEEIADDCRIIMGDQTQLHQVIINLCTNAAHAMEENGGRLTVRVGNVIGKDKEPFFDKILEPGAYVRLVVSDTGFGIPEAIRERVFDPFYSTKEVGKGSGMGLTVVHGIISSHEGGIRIRGNAAGGAAVECYFPSVDATPDKAPSRQAPLPGGKESILMIDDEPALADIGTQRLQKLGYTVRTCTDSVAALDLYRENPAAFDLVITDMAMPRMTGDRLIAEMIQISPGVKTIICTGYSDKIDPEKAGRIGAKAFIMKPIVNDTFARTVRNVLDNGPDT